MPLLLSFMSFCSILSIYRDNDITDVLDETFTTTEERFGELVATDLKPGCEETPLRHPVYPGVLWNSSMHL